MKIFLMLILLLSLCGCSGTAHKTDNIFAMDTIITLDLYGDNAQAALSEMCDEINRLDTKFRPNSSIKTDDEIKKIIDYSENISSATDGAFDIYLGDVMRIWGFRDKNYRIPSDEEITSALNSHSLDFGGIAKGYAGDRLKQIAKKNDIKSAILSLGGNVVAIGSNIDGTAWKVGIADPKNPNECLGYVCVCDKSVVTSGCYQRFFEYDDKIYHHIIDSKTGRPADSDLISVTIIADDSILADSLSTACFVLGKEKAIELYHSGKFNFEAVLIETDGNIIYTENSGFQKEA